MKILLQFVVAILSIQLYNGLFLKLEGQSPYCFYQDVQKNQKLLISYVVSGYGEDQLTFSVYSELKNANNEQQNIKQWFKTPRVLLTGKKDYEYKIYAEEKQQFKICFKCEDSYSKIVSFDFMLEDQVQNDNKGKKFCVNQQNQLDLRALTLQSMKNNFRKLEKIFRNQHYQTIRDQVHSEKIISTSNKVKWCTLLKILVLIIVCGLQIYILTAFFKKKQYQLAPQSIIE